MRRIHAPAHGLVSLARHLFRIARASAPVPGLHGARNEQARFAFIRPDHVVAIKIAVDRRILKG
ncbi:hypothetical protein OHAE_4079 [Ochrobactrum soli]|uniref:Uncharacterized protein n=1 Tax=Ochrobactrum soli TaxID=2448455 RepID=A0A2P9HB09_9HYPH|nr:hypothetical protein OHAE_4079 [[Ochrobactrum] soli]